MGAAWGENWVTGSRGEASGTGSWASAVPGSQTGLGQVTPRLRVGSREQGAGREGRHGIDEDRGAAPPRWTAQVFLPPLQLVGGALCRAEPSHACGWCPMPGGTLPCLWVVPYAGRNPPMLVGGALCRAEPSMTREGQGLVAKPPVMGPGAGTWHGSQTALSEPPTGGCHELLVGGALRRAEPSRKHDAQQRGPQHMPFREDRGAAPPRWTAQVFLPSLQLVGGALCRAEPSHACGSCPMPGGTLHDLCGARASGEATTDGSCSRHMARVTDSPERAPHRRMS